MTTVDLRDYFERMFTEHQKHHEMELAATLRALDQARATMEHRLEGLNELRREYTQDRDQLVKRDVFEARMEQFVAGDVRISDQVAAMQREQERAKGRNAAFAAIGGVLLILVPIVLQFINIGGT